MQPYKYKGQLYKWTNEKTIKGVKHTLYKFIEREWAIEKKKPIVKKVTRKAIVVADNKVKVVKGKVKDYWLKLK